MTTEPVHKVTQLSAQDHKSILGLKYCANYLTEDEEKNLLKLLGESKELTPITHSKDSRNVIQYGYTYAYNRSGVTKCSPIPEIYKKLIDTERVKKVLGSDYEFNQLIINQYNPGQGISAHIDHTKYFGHVIFCISIGASTVIDFSKEDKNDAILAEPKSAYAMTGDSRYLWKHSIAGKKSQNGIRYSLTFRKVIV